MGAEADLRLVAARGCCIAALARDEGGGSFDVLDFFLAKLKLLVG